MWDTGITRLRIVGLIVISSGCGGPLGDRSYVRDDGWSQQSVTPADVAVVATTVREVPVGLDADDETPGYDGVRRRLVASLAQPLNPRHRSPQSPWCWIPRRGMIFIAM